MNKLKLSCGQSIVNGWLDRRIDGKTDTLNPINPTPNPSNYVRRGCHDGMHLKISMKNMDTKNKKYGRETSCIGCYHVFKVVLTWLGWGINNWPLFQLPKCAQNLKFTEIHEKTSVITWTTYHPQMVVGKKDRRIRWMQQTSSLEVTFAEISWWDALENENERSFDNKNKNNTSRRSHILEITMYLNWGVLSWYGSINHWPVFRLHSFSAFPGDQAISVCPTESRHHHGYNYDYSHGDEINDNFSWYCKNTLEELDW